MESYIYVWKASTIVTLESSKKRESLRMKGDVEWVRPSKNADWLNNGRGLVVEVNYRLTSLMIISRHVRERGLLCKSPKRTRGSMQEG